LHVCDNVSKKWHFNCLFLINKIFDNLIQILVAFSALVLLFGRQERHPACKKTEWWGAGVVICLELSADLHMAQLMPAATHCPYWFYLSGTGSPG